jgi:hypothetical protein
MSKQRTALVLASNILFLLAPEVQALGLRAQNVTKLVQEALAEHDDVQLYRAYADGRKDEAEDHGKPALTEDQIIDCADNLSTELEPDLFWGFTRAALLEFAHAVIGRELPKNVCEQLQVPPPPLPSLPNYAWRFALADLPESHQGP